MDNLYFGVEAALSGARNDIEAGAMRKYMKGRFEYYGVKTPERRSLVKQAVKESDMPEGAAYADFIKACWASPMREMQYAVNDLFRIKNSLLQYSHLKWIEQLITEKSWWDTVDFLAPDMAGYLLKNNPDDLRYYATKWIQSDNIWLQRSAILVQLKYKQHTDEALLFDLISLRANSKEFFVRKGSGWALREYSKVNPQAVRKFIDSHDLSPLTVREGGKYC